MSALAVPNAYAMIQFNETAAGDARDAVAKISGMDKAIDDIGAYKLDWLF